jgi:hypothetical protein
LFALNPLVLYETFGNGHNDMAMALWILVAAWLSYRQKYTGAVVALMIGALFKYIPALFVPCALWIGWRSLPDRKTRIKFILTSGFVSLAAVVFAYAPFWDGLATLSIARRAGMFTTSLPSILYQALSLTISSSLAGGIVSSAALAMTGCFALWMAWQSGKQHNWLSFVTGSLYTLIFYLIVTCPWYQEWYVIWLVGLLALLPEGTDQNLALAIAFFSLAKPLIFGPLVFLQRPPDITAWREVRLTAGVMVPSWLVTWLVLWQKRKPV